MTHRCLLVAFSFVLLMVLGPLADRDVSAQADTLAGTLRQASRPLTWQGRVGPEDAPSGGEPAECAEVACDHFQLHIELPPGTFANPNRPGGVQVALRWFGDVGGHTLPPGVPACCGEFDTLHLFVYKDGDLVASSAGIMPCRNPRSSGSRRTAFTTCGSRRTRPTT